MKKKSEVKLYNYKIEKVIKIIDGDTFEASVSLGFYIYHTMRFRVLYLDTPEKYGTSNEEREQGILATKMAEKILLNPNSIITIKSSLEPKSSFKRFLAEVFINDVPYAAIMNYMGFEKTEKYGDKKARFFNKPRHEENNKYFMKYKDSIEQFIKENKIF